MAGNKPSAKRNSAKDIRINSDVKIKRIDALENLGFTCSCCGKKYQSQKGHFLASNSVLYVGNNGYLTTCRDCVDRYYMQLVGFYSGNTEHATERCCQIFDWYYSEEISQMAHQYADEKGRSFMAIYVSKTNLFRARGTSYMDTVRERTAQKILKSNDIIEVEKKVAETEENNKVITESPEDADSYTVSKKTVRFFGYGYTSEEYEYLEEQYGDWCARYECKTKAQEELFKNLCVAQLNIRRAQTKGIAREINDAIKVFQDLLGTANIKPNQSNDNALADQNTFGTLIKKWENERPISTPDAEWQDVDGIRQYIDTYFLGHLCNLVHVKNDQQEAYLREMEKYTVKPPVYEADDSTGETSLLDKFSDKGDLKNDNDE